MRSRILITIAIATLFAANASGQYKRGQQAAEYDTLANSYFAQDTSWAYGSGLGTSSQLTLLSVSNSNYSTGLLYVALENDSTRIVSLPPGYSQNYGLHPATFVRCKPEAGKVIIRIFTAVMQ